MPVFCQKTSILQKTPCSHAHISSKNVNSLKKLCSHIISLQIYDEKPYAVIPIFGQKNVNSVKTAQYYGPKKVNKMPTFSIFHEKIPALMPIFCKKRPFSKLSCQYFDEKTSILPKTILSCHSLQIFHKRPLLSCLYLVKKT